MNSLRGSRHFNQVAGNISENVRCDGRHHSLNQIVEYLVLVLVDRSSSPAVLLLLKLVFHQRFGLAAYVARLL